ncbi:MAG: 2-oxoacid:ferredoxin oxidoreductase subunit beta [Candidatus Scalindua sp.]|jgi:2-oxoglutarate ferredoxin oxidoreductase subunit beta|nr:2-oxoacid:ferredoxin oxidoreductase subunit beta [Candidatus Scalindua sp.]MBT5306025.1 2-oxoacid:ferredoxin oxidoreductase subunit beta [Candidatus Scalindua sp.]MBT6047590.1 2-oxoacid:ferredoxin oxidoreductase subunit beta [Candidatus Scalindua sp.]MBT6229171.1 2-oxoacid:ferredoxin oxidoreductase subunit beta [Candidatus Scalindua sp.]MBT6563858.1 2-oxoacid:ferredoxin oxidoreductase subunit beta [Candidatus Scalindua sp.]
MTTRNYFHSSGERAWCPGCGDYSILSSVENALMNLGKKPHEVLIVSGIGQAAKLPHYINTNGFDGLHGRALPAAFGAKVANHKLMVLVTSGDGDIYGEGGNHFIHAIRRNLDITLVVHNNQVYGLTKGQASPTSDLGMVTKTQPDGVFTIPFNPLQIAITLDAAFVARSFSKEIEFTSKLIEEGVNTPGFSLIDVLQPCVSFNHVNTCQWYSDRVYQLGSSYNPSDKSKSYKKSSEWGDKIPIGVIYKNSRRTYLDNLIKPNDLPLIKRKTSIKGVESLINELY